MNPLRNIAAFFVAASCTASGVEPEAREWTAPDGTVVRYRWHAPEKPEAGKTYPIVLFLHGAGERGENNKAQLKHGVLPVLDAAEKLKQPVFLIAPQCPQGRWWSPIDRRTHRLSEAEQPAALLEAILALVEETAKTQPVDRNRFYVTGISMGGFATWDLLGRVPDKIAAAVPICGGGDPALANRYANVPIWAFHGELDEAVPVETTREMVAAVEKAGGTPKVTIYPGVDHDSWTRTYADAALFEWLFAQKKK